MHMPPPARLAALSARYRAIRARTATLCAPLAIEDHVPQPVEFVSPPKWHLGHTTWFFETFVLKGAPGASPVQPYKPYHPGFDFLFNSYYESVGERVQRAERGSLSRPTVAEIHAWRAHVDAHMLDALEAGRLDDTRLALTELGLQHEQQHQELLLTDLKYILGHNPLRPVYADRAVGDIDPAREHAPLSDLQDADTWRTHEGGPCPIGHDGDGFCFDNELGRHEQHLRPFQIRRDVVRNRDFMAFMADHGYSRFEFWHAEGWEWVQGRAIQAPMYWFRHPDDQDAWWHQTLRGPEPVPPDAPLSHLSYYEAFAYAQWAGARLPTEFEWEAAAPLLDGIGARWEWTESAYKPYPGFRKADGAPGEYNGKFMVNQQVLRGASFATPPGHARRSYRNFFHAALRWQYTGLRLARDL